MNNADFDTYNKQVDELLQKYNISKSKFTSKLESIAYEQGHYAGYNEVLMILEDLFYRFQDEINFFADKEY